MDRLKLAHDYTKVFLTQSVSRTINEVVDLSFDLADAMLLEFEKREDKSRTDGLDEFQVDWSQAPEWAKWWAMDGFSNKANWYYSIPYIDEDSDGEYEWNIELRSNGETYSKAPSFNYQGNWKDSLRGRK